MARATTGVLDEVLESILLSSTPREAALPSWESSSRTGWAAASVGRAHWGLVPSAPPCRSWRLQHRAGPWARCRPSMSTRLLLRMASSAERSTTPTVLRSPDDPIHPTRYDDPLDQREGHSAVVVQRRCIALLSASGDRPSRPWLGPGERHAERQNRDIQVGRGGLTPLAPTNRFTCGPTSELSVVCAGVSGPT